MSNEYSPESENEAIKRIRRDFSQRDTTTAFRSVRENGYPPESLLLAVLRAEEPEQEQLEHRCTTIIVALCGFACLWLAAGITLLSTSPSFSFSVPLLFFAPMVFLLTVSFFGSLVAGRTAPTCVQRRCVLCLCTLCETVENVRCVGPLLDGLGCWWLGPISQTVWKIPAAIALARLLPKLQTADKSWLTKGQVKYLETCAQHLWQVRNREWPGETDTINRTFYPAVLTAIGQVGEASALPLLNKLSRLKPASESKKVVREAAQAAFCILEARLRV